MSNFLQHVSRTKYKACGLNLENFLFDLMGANIELKKIKKRGKNLTFWSSSVNHKIIEQTALNCGLVLKVIGQGGLKKIVQTLPYKIGMLLAIIFGICSLTYFSHVVLSVEYNVDQNHVCTNGKQCIFLDENLKEIQSQIQKYITVGKKFDGNIKAIQNEVMANNTLVENCSIVKDGCNVKILLYEAVQKDAEKEQTILAKENCVIKSITTYSGKALVKAGDVVKKGQVLVESDNGVLPRASIIAKIWYVGNAFHNCNQTVLQETGNDFTTSKLSILDWDFWNAQTCDYKYYKLEKSETYATNMLVPIKITTYKYSELELVSKYVDFEQVKQSVLSKSKQDAIAKASGTPQEYTYSIVKQGDSVRVDCYLLCEEQIGTSAE